MVYPYGVGKHGRSSKRRNEGWDGCCSLLSTARLRTPLLTITVLLVACGPAASPQKPLSPNQKAMAEIRRTISTANIMIFKFSRYGVCGPAVYGVHGPALVSFAETLNMVEAFGEGAVIESPPMLYIDVYRGAELVNQLQMLEYRLVRHRGLDADMAFLAEGKLVRWFKSQSIPIRCFDWDDIY